MTDDIPSRACGVEGCDRHAVALTLGGVLASTPYSPTYFAVVWRGVVACAALVVVVEYAAVRPLRRWSA